MIEYDDVVAAMVEPSSGPSVTGKSPATATTRTPSHAGLTAGELHSLEPECKTALCERKCNPLRPSRRVSTAHRITRLRAAADRPARAGRLHHGGPGRGLRVSRRTLFNYFPGKVDAVLGAVPDLDPEDRGRRSAPAARTAWSSRTSARSGAPMLDVAISAARRWRSGRRVLTRQPAPAGRGCTRASSRSAPAFELLVLDREGPSFDAARARLLVRLVLAVFDAALDAYLASTPERPMVELYDATLADARALLA